MRKTILFFWLCIFSCMCYGADACILQPEEIYNRITFREDTVGCCNAEKIFIVSQELEDTTIIYDGSYQKIRFPNGDVDPHKGVCTDVIIRTLRIALSYDLQKEVYLYRKSQNLPTDTNIDHRQCKKLVPFFEHLLSLGIVEKDGGDMRKGSIVFIREEQRGYFHTFIYLGDGYIMHNDGRGQIIEEIPQNIEYVSYHFK